MSLSSRSFHHCHLLQYLKPELGYYATYLPTLAIINVNISQPYCFSILLFQIQNLKNFIVVSISHFFCYVVTSRFNHLATQCFNKTNLSTNRFIDCILTLTRNSRTFSTIEVKGVLVLEKYLFVVKYFLKIFIIEFFCRGRFEFISIFKFKSLSKLVIFK